MGNMLNFISFVYSSFQGPTKKMNYFQSLTDAMDIALSTDETAGKKFLNCYL